MRWAMKKMPLTPKNNFPTILFPPFETWVLEVAAVFGSEISAVFNFIKFQFSIAGEK